MRKILSHFSLKMLLALEKKRWIVFIIILTTTIIDTSRARSLCPVLNRGDSRVCDCTVKRDGVILICDGKSLEDLKNPLDFFRERGGQVIKYLVIRNFPVTTLLNGIFQGLDIRQLIVSNTTLSVLEESSLSAVGTKLELLDLPNNRIDAVPTPALKHLNVTKLFTLNHNNITSVGPKAFDGMTSLVRLYLYDNKIDRIDSEAFEGIESLQFLNIGGNRLTSIPTKAFMRLSNLRILNLQENRIETIEENDFDGLTNLDSLNLASNFITELGPFVFRSLPKLSELDFQSNRIHRVDKNAFTGVEETLKWLKMSNNSIKEIPTEALKGLQTLQEFDFKDNQISGVKEDAFDTFGNTVQYVFLQNNQISRLPSTVFGKMHFLYKVSIGNNKLKHLRRELFQPISDNVEIIDVGGNPLVCDCDLLWYQKWLRQKMTTDTYFPREISAKTHCWIGKPEEKYNINDAPLEESCPPTTDEKIFLRVINLVIWTTNNLILS